MGTDVLKSYSSLEQELNTAKNVLTSLNDNIRFYRNDRKRRRDTSPVQQPSKRRNQNESNRSVFSRLSGPMKRNNSFEEPDNKPRIQSRVIKELPTRQEVVAAQGDDEISRARNRRMFGSLLGTLQKFTQEEAKLKSKVDKKAKIEKKLEEQEKLERINMKKERETMFITRKKKQLEIKKLEIKMDLMQEFEAWEKTKRDLKYFIKTKSKPHIFYKPKFMNEKLTKQLAKCAVTLEEDIENRRKKVNEEIHNVDVLFKQKEEELHKNRSNKFDDEDGDIMDPDVEIDEQPLKIEDLSNYDDTHHTDNGQVHSVHSKLPKIRVKIENDEITGETKLKSVVAVQTIEGTHISSLNIPLYQYLMQA